MSETKVPDSLRKAVLAEHPLVLRFICGARSIHIVHHHGSETDKRPGPRRQVRCTEDAGHEGKHKDAICCWNFETFEDWQVDHFEPTADARCGSCGENYPCKTVRAVQYAEYSPPTEPKVTP